MTFVRADARRDFRRLTTMLIQITTVVHIIVSLVMIVVVLLQVGKGASIGSTFGGASSQTLFGSAGPATMLAKITYTCVAIFMITSLYLTYTASNRNEKSIMSDMPAVTRPVGKKAPEAAGEKAVPATPAPAMEKTAPASPAKPSK